MFKKPLLIATTAAALFATATFSTQAKAGRPDLRRPDGRRARRDHRPCRGRPPWGGRWRRIGAFAGAASSASHGYYDGGYYNNSPSYYGPTYAPDPPYGYGYAPVYPSATIVYSSGPSLRIWPSPSPQPPYGHNSHDGNRYTPVTREL